MSRPKGSANLMQQPNGLGVFFFAADLDRCHRNDLLNILATAAPFGPCERKNPRKRHRVSWGSMFPTITIPTNRCAHGGAWCINTPRQSARSPDRPDTA